MPNDFSDTLAPNILPANGEVHLFEDLISRTEALRYFDRLLTEIPWRHDVVKIFGKTIVTKRKTAWFGDSGFNYIYSGVGRIAQPWSETLLELKAVAESRTGSLFNSCLLNLYHDGSEGMSWHSDDEKPLGNEPTIAAISLGAERIMRFRCKSREFAPVSVKLASGSMVLMSGLTQSHWQHSIPVMKRVDSARISLTFRKIIPDLL